MPKKPLALLIILLLIPALACFDTFAVPGIQVAPDGSSIYFLENSQLTLSESEADMFGQIATAMLNGEQSVLVPAVPGEYISAFAVNPVNGDIAYVNTSESSVSTTIQVYSNGATRELVAASTFAQPGFGTMMSYSPDGSLIALSMLLYPEGFDPSASTLETGEENVDLSLFDSVVYLIEPTSGAIIPVSDPATWATAVAWSPSGTALAYNAWADTNGDGQLDISGLGGAMMGLPSDNSHIYVYDVANNQVTQATSEGIAYGPEFLTDMQVAYVRLSGLETQVAQGGIEIYDLTTGSAVQAYSAGENLVLGLAVSPDGSQVAWAENTTDEATGDSTSAVYVSDSGFASPRLLASLPAELGPVDVPVWLPDGSAVLIGSTNFLASLVGSFAGAFASSMGEFSESTGGEVDMGEVPMQTITRVDVATGETSVVFTGSLANSNYLAALLAFASSGLTEQMESSFGDFSTESE